MPSRHLRWLEAELPRLVDAGVIDAVAAGRIRAHYAEESEQRAAVPLFAVLGALLVGLGIVLLLAHNWESLSRPERAALSIGLLVFAQAVAGYALLRRLGSVAWSEGAALFLILASGATVALLGQTYQVPGDLRSFLLTWLLLALPVPYLWMSRAAAALYLVGALVWVIDSRVEGESVRLWWLWLAAVVPLLVGLARREPSARDSFLGWVAVPCIAAGVGTSVQLQSSSGVMLFASSLTAALYVAGAVARTHGSEPFYGAPARILGGLTIAVAAVFLGQPGALGHDFDVSEAVGWEERALTLAIGAACAGFALLGALRLATRAWPRALFAALPLFVGLGILSQSSTGSPWPASALFNAYALAAGIGFTLLGMRESSTGIANLGFLLLAWLVFYRFVDFQLSYTLRGLAFIALGIGFLLFNLRLRRARKPA